MFGSGLLNPLIMPMISPYVIELSTRNAPSYSGWARRLRAEVRDAQRAWMILAAARGKPDSADR
jgi:hypothetical protein